MLRAPKIQPYCVLRAHFGVGLGLFATVHATGAGGGAAPSGVGRELMGSKPGRLLLGSGRFGRRAEGPLSGDLIQIQTFRLMRAGMATARASASDVMPHLPFR